MKTNEHFGESYFVERRGNDPFRQKAFAQERAFLQAHLGKGFAQTMKVLDYGCSTGEFLDFLGWNRNHSYGLEISDFARKLAQQKGIRFDKDLENGAGFFDLILFRGTLQYLPEPFTVLEAAARALKPGGHLVFLATPNARSPYYFCFGTLPFLEEKHNFLIPSDHSLKMNLENLGLKVVSTEYPYWHSPYARPFLDVFKFARKLLFRTSDRFAFWKSSMNLIARKP